VISPRARLIHARLWLGSETQIPLECRAGVILAIRKIEAARDSVFSNSAHSSMRCKRCLEIAAIALEAQHDPENCSICEDQRRLAKRTRELHEDEGWPLREAKALAIAKFGGAQ
jgi:hypothetical protein